MDIQFPVLNVAALAPQLILTVTALLVMIVDMYTDEKQTTGYLSLVGLVAAGLTSLVMFGTPSVQTFQDMAASDGYSLVLNLVFVIAAILSILISLGYLDRNDMQRGEYYALLLFATVGMMLMGAATDLIIIFMGLEIMSIALYIMTGFNRRQMASGEAGMKYFVLGAFASAFFLYGAALIYGATGTTNLIEIGEWFTRDGAGADYNDPMALVGLGLLLIGFGFKVAAVPFQWWTPDVYQGAPTSVTAFMSVGAKAAGFAALVRVLMVSFDETFVADWRIAIALLAFLTMTIGNVVALAQKDVKRMLAYSSVAHAGYLLVGVAAANQEGINGMLFYLMAYAFVNVGAFGVVAVLERSNQVGTHLTDYAGLAGRKPWLALTMALFMFSLTGIPPFIGFWGKLYVFRAAIAGDMTWLAVAGMLNSAVSAFYYVGIVVQMYMRSPADVEEEGFEPAPLHLNPPVVLSLGLAVAATVILGLWPTPLVTLTSLGLFG